MHTELTSRLVVKRCINKQGCIKMHKNHSLSNRLFKSNRLINLGKMIEYFNRTIFRSNHENGTITRPTLTVSTKPRTFLNTFISAGTLKRTIYKTLIMYIRLSRHILDQSFIAAKFIHRIPQARASANNHRRTKATLMITSILPTLRRAFSPGKRDKISGQSRLSREPEAQFSYRFA